MAGLKSGVVESTDNDNIKIKTDGSEVVLDSSELSFQQGESVELDINGDGRISYIKKTSGEIEKLFFIYDEDGVDTKLTYTSTLFEEIPVVSASGEQFTALAVKEKVPGEYSFEYGLRLSGGTSDDRNPLEMGGLTVYSEGPYTEVEMKDACKMLAEFCKKQSNISANITGDDFGFIFRQIQLGQISSEKIEGFNNESARKYIWIGKGQYVIDNSEKFELFDVETANKFLYFGHREFVIENPEKFASFNYETADKLIHYGMGGFIAKNLEKFQGLDHNRMANKLIDEGYIGDVLENKEKFQGLDKATLDRFKD